MARIRLPRAAVLAQLTTALATAKKDLAALPGTAEVQARVDAQRARLIAAARKALKDPKTPPHGAYLTFGRDHTKVELTVHLPAEPAVEGEGGLRMTKNRIAGTIENLERAIRMLNMSTDEFVPANVMEDFEAYL